MSARHLFDTLTHGYDAQMCRVTVSEWMQTFSPPLIIPVNNPYGADNSVYAARIRWAKPNAVWDKH